MLDRNNKIAFQPIEPKSGLKPKKMSFFLNKKRFILIIASLILVVSSVMAGFLIWYNIQLSPLDSKSKSVVKVIIATGSSPSQIAKQLKSAGLIRDESAFGLYLRIIGKRDVLQAGTYRLSASESVSDIVAHLSAGSTDQFTITFFPGATLVDNTSKAISKKTDVTTVLKNAGYSDNEIKLALSATYDSPLFASKPASADLEGYVYGETYKFGAGASVTDILKVVFAEFYSNIEKNGLVAKFKSHGLNLYQGITLASIIQREVITPEDQKQAAQVFYKRLAEGTVLGSDVTYQYIADKTGVERDPSLDSPYNTRRFSGLTPGPISTPGLSALIAAANPATGDYLYFLSGDDDITYFGRTLAEHEANIVNHCKVKCSTF
jgi:UPF0755 protein